MDIIKVEVLLRNFDIADLSNADIYVSVGNVNMDSIKVEVLCIVFDITK